MKENFENILMNIGRGDITFADKKFTMKENFENILMNIGSGTEVNDVSRKIHLLLNNIETYDTKVLTVAKEFKDEFKSIFPDFLINPGYQIKNCTNILVKNDEITIKNYSLFFYGLYIKKQRNVSQTPMPGVKNAVSDIFKPFNSFYKSDDFRFVPAGREDKDVLNIKGRPFFIEIINPKTNLNQSIEKECLMNEFVFIENFTRVKETEIKKFILEGERSHKKTYSLYVSCTEKKNLRDLITDKDPTTNGLIDIDLPILEKLIGKTMVIHQQTPLRVLHRRSNSVREREICILSVKKFGNYLHIRLKSSAGTYIKEFVTSDFGRTSPSLSSLLNCICDCVQLDVEEIENHILPPNCIFE